MSAVVVVDAGMGNLRSVARALERAGAKVELASDPERVRRADRLVLPGQGHFGDFARVLADGLGEVLREHIASDRPLLGICLGMQVLFERSEEAPGLSGLGVMAGEVRRFASDLVDESGRRLKVPQIGWNEIEGHHALLPKRDWFYFVHSYYCAPVSSAETVAECQYGPRFCAAVARGALFACQFHPEKSQHAGAALLDRFLRQRWS